MPTPNDTLRYLRHLRRIKPAYAPNFNDPDVVAVWTGKLAHCPLEVLHRVCLALKQETSHIWPSDFEQRILLEMKK
jgi:hypothetical protein